MLPLWLMFPALSPQDRFIDNVYRLDVPVSIGEELSLYVPDVQVKQFLTEIRADKEESSSPFMPTSTMPSAHIVWIILIGYYLFKTRIIFGFLSLPLLLLSGFGTVFLAQHYFVDVIGGIFIAGVAITVVSLLKISEAEFRPAK